MTAWLIFHLLVGAGGAWLARRYALSRNLLDQPGERRSHRVPTPRSGGIGIVLAVLLGGLWLLRTAGSEGPVLGLGLIGFALVAGIGLLDDHNPLSPWPRLGVQAIAAGLLAAGCWWTWQDGRIAMVAFAAALVLANVWNFMDGIDGIATTQAMLVAAGVLAMGAGGWVAMLALALVAACLGFLPFNFPRARLFLGDVGSGALGYLLAMLMVAAMANAEFRNWPAWLLIPSAFLLDAGLTLAGRLMRGEAWWQPHALHLYQVWARRLGRHPSVTLAYAGWTALAVAIALALRETAFAVNAMLSIAWYIACTAAWAWLQGKGTTA